ncbi:MAG TPA: hypothetical protein P5181_14080 [Dermatophilaceae bacterium]|nr:hypothetical protein [Dermatophilaceae bacterium]
MQPSSLVFVAVIVIWAAFLVQHWVRRREDIATARTVDRFSEAMRLLERRPIQPAIGPRGASVSRASSGGSPRAGVAGPLAGGSVATAAGSRSPLVARTAVAGSAGAPGESAASPGNTRPFRAAAGRLSRRALLARRARGVFLLGALVAVPVTVLTSALEQTYWWSVGIAAAAVVIAVVMLRYAAVRARTRRTVDRSIARTAARRVGSAAPVGSASEVVESAGSAGAVANPEPAQAAEPVVSEVAIAAHEGDARAAQATTASVGGRAAYRMGRTADGTWVPIPVPPPTYTLKARVERPQPEPAQVTPEPAAHATPLVAADQETARRDVG